ncbi:alpha/beta-hydrolase [Athelia psychrophila]|uniref:triacylglycerol lipase n=1 Tax=Athelia psychrophila TaxID=1759441 RepID=A0A166BEA2_9AGAM|nr:alpha/beta-hydrolase [Fibularhizoctonia sp. CBS 109695]
MHLLSIALLFLLCPTTILAGDPPVKFGLHHTVYYESGTPSLSIERQHPIQASPTLKARPTTVYRPRSQAALEHARLRSLRHAESEEVEWDLVETMGPDVQDKHTLSQLARMTSNAYALPGRGWYDIDPTWNNSYPFGWEEDQDGFRGHVFVSTDESTVVLAIKGTTITGVTSKKDKFNDNLLFSCCCAWVDFTWTFSTVCKCHSKSWRCDSTCLSDALIEDSLFYLLGVEIVSNVTSMYPNSTIWLVGHSLGGALASLLGSTFGLPAVAFESPGERIAATRLHLPIPPSSAAWWTAAPVTHVYHNADPIPQGTCTGIGSPCTAAGYALETRCHLGKSIVYDAVGKLKWGVNIQHHPIREVINKVIEAEAEWEWEEGRDVPLAREEADCVDCFKWEFFENI